MLINEAQDRMSRPDRASQFWERIEPRIADDVLLRRSLGVFLKQLEEDSVDWESYQSFYLRARAAMNSLFAVEDGGLFAQLLHEIAEAWQNLGPHEALRCLRGISREYELSFLEPASFDRFLVQVLNSPETFKRTGKDAVVLLVQDRRACAALTRAMSSFEPAPPVEVLTDESSNERTERVSFRASRSLRRCIEDLLQSGATPVANATYAIKMSRRGRNVDLHREFFFHKWAWHRLAELDESRRKLFASVPHPFFVHDVAISGGEIEGTFQSHDIRTDTSGSRQVDSRSLPTDASATAAIVMESIPGADFATRVAQRILEARGLQPAELERMSFVELRGEVRTLLGLESVTGVTGKAARRVRHRNSVRVWEELQRIRFGVSSEHIRRLERTLDLLHEVEVYHGDSDERNLIFGGDAEDDNAQLTLVDFGNADRGPDLASHDASLVASLSQFSTHS